MVAPDATRRLEALLGKAERSARLSFEEIRELARLYRLHAAQLAHARQRGTDADAVRYLNALCVRAYSLVHAEPARPRRARWFWWRELPRALGRTWHLQLCAALLLASGALIGAGAVARDPETLPALVPSAMHSADALARLANEAEAREDFLTRREVDLGEKSVFGAYLFTNNTRVGVLAFATGPLLGLPTLLLLLYNGLTLGAFCAIFMGSAQGVAFLAWIVPHGIPELLAIVLCASGGLAMGLSLVAPGRDGRGVSLRSAAADALALVLAAFPLFVVAALIESFVRQSLWSTPARFAVAAAVTLALVGYVWLVAHLARRAPHVDTTFLERDRAQPQSARRSSR
jgi:uncharacterized membrane protein SpoIIM required for sporulation